MTLPEAYRAQAQYIQASPKFQLDESKGMHLPVDFPGYSVITPPWEEDAANQSVYKTLQQFQKQIIDQLSSELLVPLPPESFHLTLADLIWDSAYYHASAKADFQEQLCDRVQQSFDQCYPLVHTGQPSYWQVLGLTIMPRALGVVLLPKDELSYERVLHLRRSLYQNSGLIALGIEQQYHLTAHITLGYFGAIATVAEKEKLSQEFNELNLQWLSQENPIIFEVHCAELRKFDNMIGYYRQPDWPTLAF